MKEDYRILEFVSKNYTRRYDPKTDKYIRSEIGPLPMSLRFILKQVEMGLYKIKRVEHIPSGKVFSLEDDFFFSHGSHGVIDSFLVDDIFECGLGVNFDSTVIKGGYGDCALDFLIQELSAMNPSFIKTKINRLLLIA